MKKISIATKDIVHLVSTDEVIYCKAEGSFCLIKLEDRTEIKVSKNLNWVLNQFAGTGNIIKVHRSWAINKKFFIRVEKFAAATGKHALLMKGGFLVPYAARTASSTIDALREIPNDNTTIQSLMNQIFSLSLADRLMVVQRIMHAVKAPFDRNSLRQIAQ